MGTEDRSEHIVDQPVDADIVQARVVGTKARLMHPFKYRRATLITDVKQSPEQNRRHREIIYKWLQGSRVPLLLLSALTYLFLHNIVLSVVLFAISIPLPWISVVIANGHGQPRDSRLPQVYKPALARERNAQGVLPPEAPRRAIEQDGPVSPQDY